MPINYVLVEKGKPSDPDYPKKFYAQVKSSGDTILRDIAENMSDMSTVSSADVFGMLEGMLKTIPKELLEGKIVKLGDFGSFYLTLVGKGAESRDTFDSSMIDKIEIKFRPGKIMKNMLKKAKFKKID